MGLRETPIRRSLNRSAQLFGAEREWVVISGLMAATLIILSFSVPIVLIGVSMWAICIACLRMMAKADPLMSKVYRKHVKYQLFYVAKSRPYRDF